MKKFFANKITIGILGVCVVGGIGYAINSYDIKNIAISAFADDKSEAETTQTLYKEETVERTNIIVGVTETGVTALSNTGVTYDLDVDISDVAVKTGQFVNEGDFIANVVLTDKDDLYDAYVNEKDNYQDQIDNYYDQIETYEKQITSYEKQITSYEKQIVSYQEQYDDYLEDLSVAWKDHEKVLIDAEISKSDASKKLESNLSSTTSLEVSYALEQEELALETAKMERDLQLLYDDYDSLVAELAEGYDETEAIENAEKDLDDINDEITLVEKETAHAYVCDRDNYVNYWEGCSHLDYEHDLTKLATELTSLKSQRAEARLKVAEAVENTADAETVWRTNMQASIDKALLSIEDKEISIKEYELSQTSKSMSTADNYKEAEYTVSTAEATYQSTIMQIDNTIYNSEAKIKGVETSLVKTEESIEEVNEDIEEVYADIADINKDISDIRTDIVDARKDLSSVSMDSIENKIYAPTTGYIVTVSSDGTVKSGTDIVSIGDSNEIEILVSISQEDISDVYIGMETIVVFDAYPDITFRAEIDTISMSPASGMQTTVNYTVTILCDVSQSTEAVIYGGMTGDVTFIQREKNDIIAISNKCVFTDESGKEYVKIKNILGEIETVPVTTGFSDGFDVEIIEGLNDGDIVVIESAVTGQ